MKSFVLLVVSVISTISFCADKKDDIAPWRTAIFKKLGKKGEGRGLHLRHENLTKILKTKTKDCPTYEVVDENIVFSPNVDLSGAYLKYANLNGLSLAAVNLYDANCSEADFTYTNFTDEDGPLFPMDHVNLSDTFLHGTEMSPGQVYCTLCRPGTKQQESIGKKERAEVRKIAKKRGIIVIKEKKIKKLTPAQEALVQDLIKTGDGKGKNFTGIDLRPAVIIAWHNRMIPISDRVYVAVTRTMSPGEYLFNFEGATLDETNFSKLLLQHINFSGASAVGASFRGTIFVDDNIDTKNFNLSKAYVDRAVMSKKYVDNTSLTKKQKEVLSKQKKWYKLLNTNKYLKHR